MERQDSSSSDDGYPKEDMTVEIFSGSQMETVLLPPTGKWNSEVGSVLEFIGRRLLRGEIDYPIFLEMIMTRIVKITGSEFGNLALKDGDTTTCIALGEKELGYISPLSIDQQKTSDGIFGHSLSQDKIVVSNDVPKDPRRRKSQLPEGHPKIKTLVLVPLQSQWILSLANKKSYRISDVVGLLPLLPTLRRVLQKSRSRLLSRNSPPKDVSSYNKFLAAMSHDLRTPLNGILGMITLLPEAGSLTPKQKEYITSIKECTFQMVTLVNNFLDFNKMVSDSLILKKEPLKIKNSVKDALAIVRGNAINKGLDLDFHLPKKMPILMGDRARLTQILSNLLSNAVKFTEKGSVGLSVEITKITRRRSSRPRKWRVTFKVKDTGIGIPPEDQERIFEFFRQARSLNTFLSRSGTGFGLSFSRELVRLMGGKISVESEVGKGSTFTFFLIMEEDTHSQVGGLGLGGSRVLVVDDRQEIRLYLSEILFQWGCIPIALGSAKEALQYLGYDSKFNIAMIDICMPNMTGIELAQELREKYPNLPLIGISSAELMGGEEYFDCYMYKPIDQNQLFSLASKCLAGNPTKKKKSRSKLRILIAEDNKYNSAVLRELLLSLGFRDSKIKIVDNGKDCVAETRKKPYDVILMDILMPVMDGIEASKKILESLRPPMIIAASAAVMNVDKARCQKVGISGYLEKPISKKKLEVALLPLVSARKKHKRGKKKNQDGH